jgi:tRNA threonylcarbamoyladenosine biosynthesis protein TsaB
MLGELLPNGNLVDQGIDAIAYAQGPGSFTGLRIAASAVQGLAFANQLPAIAISTLACQAQTALRASAVGAEDTVLSLLDARINEVYWALYTYRDELATVVQGPVVCAPKDIIFSKEHACIKGVGGGFCYRDSLPEVIASALVEVAENILPSARDLIPLALAQYKLGNLQAAVDVRPVYVREEVSWKKISEQGKRL